MRPDTVNGIRAGIDSRAIKLNYQPIIKFKEKSVYCLEALLHWPQLKACDIPTEQFIEQIERTPDLCVEFDHYILATALDDFRLIQNRCGYEGLLSVNISPISLESPLFADYIHTLLQQGSMLHNSGNGHDCPVTPINPRQLILEITERHRWKNSQQITETLHALTEMGVRIAVDDFITGYANFGALLNEDVSIIKIDRTVTDKVLTDRSVRQFFHSFIDLTRHLHKTVLIEGIEEVEQAVLLHSEGYNLFQGFYFSKAVNVESICEYIQAFKTQTTF